MNILNKAKGISGLPQNKLDVILGFPGAGKTTLASSYPKPLLYVQIGDDGGGIVLQNWGEQDVQFILLENDGEGTIYTKLMCLLNELKDANGGGYKTVVIDAYSSIEESMVQLATKNKGKTLSWDERGAITQALVTLRDTIVALSKNLPTIFVEISHLKSTDSTDNISGESTLRYIPKMSANNGNIMLERANNVMYCARKVVKNENGEPEVKFLTYIGAHPNIDTKFRYKSEQLKDNKGIYIEDCTYEKIQALMSGKTVETAKVTEVIPEDNDNPFNDKENKEW